MREKSGNSVKPPKVFGYPERGPVYVRYLLQMNEQQFMQRKTQGVTRVAPTNDRVWVEFDTMRD